MARESIYRQKILDYVEDPVNYGVVTGADIAETGNNPLCGDSVVVTAKVKDGKFADIKFTADGCAISKAYASMTTELLVGRPLDEVNKMSDEDLINKLDICLTPARIKCALLCFRTIKKAIPDKEG